MLLRFLNFQLVVAYKPLLIKETQCSLFKLVVIGSCKMDLVMGPDSRTIPGPLFFAGSKPNFCRRTQSLGRLEFWERASKCELFVQYNLNAH